MKKQNNIKRFSLMLLLAMLVLPAVATAQEQQEPAQIWTTDVYGIPVTDYSPTDTVYIKGSGFDSDSVIIVRVEGPDGWFGLGFDGLPDVDVLSNENPYEYVTSWTFDENGIFTIEYIKGWCGGTFYVSVWDENGNFLAETIFTDASVGDVTISPTTTQTITAGESATYTVTVPKTGGSTLSVTLSIVGSLPSDASATFSVNPVEFLSSESGSKTSTLTIQTSASGSIGDFDFLVRGTKTGTGDIDDSQTVTLTVEEAEGPAEVDVVFDQNGVYTDFTGVVATIDGNDYGVGELPVTITKEIGEEIEFEYYSPLLVTADVKQYVWTSTSGLSADQNDIIVVPVGGGSVNGNYGTQYYLTLVTDPLGITTPIGEGWYNADANAPISTDEFVDDDPNDGQRYRFDGWTTADMNEIDDPNALNTTVYMDKAKTVTAIYQLQYELTLVTNPLDITTPTGAGWYDADANAPISTNEFVDDDPNDGQRYHFVGWTTTDMNEIDNPNALSTTVYIDKAKTVTANYQLQYELTLVTDPNGITTPTGGGWYDANTPADISTSSPVSVAPYTYFFSGWTTADMNEIANPNILSTTVYMDKGKTVTANYVRMIPGTGGKTLGFWSNKNGQSYIGPGDLTMLCGLNLVNRNGSAFDPTSYTQLKNWLLKADATYMDYMLSAQLAAAELSVFNGLLSGSQLVWVDDGDLIYEPGEAQSINDIMNNANNEIGSGDRAQQEYYKNLLDKINNNLLWFVI